MADDFSAYVPMDEAIRSHLDSIAKCRCRDCHVPVKHPFYPVAYKKPFYYGRNPCLPVTPTWLQPGKVMILGLYPTCGFASIKTRAGTWEREVPVEDIDEPLEYTRYFDGYSVRDVRTGTDFLEDYITPLGLKKEDLWITNMVKCFLFKPEHITSLHQLGWAAPPVEATRGLSDDDPNEKYFEVARVCIQQNLHREIELCRSKLILALGEYVCRMIHADENGQPAGNQVWKKVRGKPLRAGSLEPPGDVRQGLFYQTNIFHMYHPKSVRDFSQVRRLHEQQHLPAVKAFMVELGLP